MEEQPEGSSGAALNFEDGCVLGSLFSRLQTRDRGEILRLLGAYQEIRQERCEQGIQSDLEITGFCTLPAGPDRDRRNEGFKQSEANQSLDWDEESEETLRGTWEQYRVSLAYEAYDAADDWWVDWGAMAQRMAAANNATIEIATRNEVQHPPHFSAIQTIAVINEA